MQTVKPSKLNFGDTIGIFCASHIYTARWYDRVIWTLERLGFKIKVGDNAAKDTWGFIASAEERAADLNALVSDSAVKMVFFGGGDSGNEILPLIDYDNIRRNPKLFCSHSDGASILNAIYAQTGLVTYYDSYPGCFENLRHYDWEQFKSNFIDGGVTNFVSDSNWRTINGGVCKGTLIGGYSPIFTLMLGSKYFKYDGKYLLFIEDHQKYSGVGAYSEYLAFIEQSEFMRGVCGVIFGHYSDDPPETLFGVFERFAKRNDIPAVYTDDFGHRTKNAIFPIGVQARLDANAQTIEFLG